MNQEDAMSEETAPSTRFDISVERGGEVVWGWKMSGPGLDVPGVMEAILRTESMRTQIADCDAMVISSRSAGSSGTPQGG